jgi:iron complex outermembrane recepter protein
MQTPNILPIAARLCTALGVLAVLASLVSAQSASAGSIGGRVQNSASGSYLNNARITIEGTSLTTLTNEFGEYFIAGVPTGEARVTVFYSGMPPQTKSVTVGMTQRASQDFDLATDGTGGPVRLDPFTISASREMSQADMATNEQRFAPNMKTVLAADTFGDQTENNVAEFLKLMPAISVAYLEDHANSVSIRGMPSATTIVTANGNQIASNTNSGGNSRAFEFEQLSINDVARIEINKSLLPDMPAEGIGGTVNLITKSAFERSRPEFRYRSYLNFNSTLVTFKKTPGPGREPTYKIQPAFDFTYTNPLHRNFGISVGAAHIKKYVPMYIAGTTWNLNPDPITGVENPFVASITTQDTPKQIQRTSGRVSADWRFAPHDVLSVGFSEAYYREQGMNHRFDVSMGTNPVTVTPAFAQGRLSAGSVTNRGSQTIKSGTTWTPEFKWTHNGPVWKFESGGAFSHASIVRRAHEKGFVSNATFNVGTINPSGTGLVGPTIRFDNTGDYLPTITTVLATGESVDVRSLRHSYLTTGTYNAGVQSVDIKKTLRFTGQRTVDVFIPITVKAGGDVRQSIRDRRSLSPSFTFLGPDGIAASADNAASLYDFVDERYSTVVPPFGNPMFQWGEQYRVWETRNAHQNWFSENVVSDRNNSITNSSYLDEVIASGFVRLDGSFFRNRLTFAGGVRFQNYEVTSESGKVDTLGRYLHDEGGDLVLNPATGQPVVLAGSALETSERTNIERGIDRKTTVRGYYPSLNVAYRISENLYLRANVAKSINYPELSQIVAAETISDFTANPRRLTVNKPLEPWTANNYDIDIEYYTQNGGAVTLAFFRKDISNFIRQSTFNAGTPEATAALTRLGYGQLAPFNYEVIDKFNEGEAKLAGWEFSVDQKLDSYMPGWARGLRAFANTSYKAAPKGVAAGDLEAFSRRLMNWGVSYRRGPFATNLKWNHNPERKLAAPDPTQTRPNSQTYMDVDVSYQFHPKMSFFASATNVTGTARSSYVYTNRTPDYARRRQTNYYGAAIVAGVKGQF